MDGSMRSVLAERRVFCMPMPSSRMPSIGLGLEAVGVSAIWAIDLARVLGMACVASQHG